MRAAATFAIVASSAVAGVVAFRVIAPSSHAVRATTATAIAGHYEDPPAVRAHWPFPIPPQGEPPDSYDAAVRSLRPEACGVCHPAQLALWQGSRHARATGPGVHAQLIEMWRTNPADARSCSTCHAPMTEQQARSTAGNENPLFEPALYQAGISCATCHVRDHVRYGPPRRGAPVADPPHGGFVASDVFETSELCAHCHQFPTGWPALGGKLLANTYLEWRASDYPAQGATCQTCHMPDRAHRFRGIHDLETTRAGVTIALDDERSWSRGRGAIRLAITNTGVGHMFPTYVTPAVEVTFVQLDAAGAPIAATEQMHRIGRHLPISLDRELADTRIAPHAAARFDYGRRPHARAQRLRVRVDVDPDEFYRRLYQARLKRDNPPEVASAYAAALAETDKNRYTLWERDVEVLQ